MPSWRPCFSVTQGDSAIPHSAVPPFLVLGFPTQKSYEAILFLFRVSNDF